MRIALLLTFLAAMPAMAQEPDFNFVGIQQDLENDQTTFWGEKEFGKHFIGRLQHKRYAHTNNSHTTQVGVGVKWDVTPNLVPYARVTYMRGEVKNRPVGEDETFSQVAGSIGVKYGFGRIWQTGTVLTYADNSDHFGSYWSELVFLKAYPWGDQLGVGVIAKHNGYNKDWSPSVYFTYHFGGDS